MVGGKVIGIVRRRDTTTLNVEDDNGDTCTVRCHDEIIPGARGDAFCFWVGVRVQIQLGDSVWWQGGCVYWTPRDRRQIDVKDAPLAKIGYSH